MHMTSTIVRALGVLSVLITSTVNALTIHATNGTKKPLRVGVLYEQVQMSDLVGLDFLGHQTPEIMAVNAAISPAYEPLLKLTTPMEFLYISSSLDATWTTPKMWVKPTHTYENAPRDLDILLLGGPNFHTVKESSLPFLREAMKKTKVVMTTCSGAMWLAKSGSLDGKKATTNRVVLETAKKLFPKVQWQDQSWVIEDGHFEGSQIWTSGGAGCGVDMFIEFTDRTFSKKLTQIGCAGLDFSYENRSQFYDGPLETIDV